MWCGVVLLTIMVLCAPPVIRSRYFLFLCFSPHSFFFVPLSWVSLTSTGSGLVEISPHRPKCSLPTYLFCYFFLGATVYFFFYTVLLFYWLLSPPHWGALVICLWVCFFSWPSLVSSLLAAATFDFLPSHPSVSFAVYASHLPSLVLLWIVF